MKKKMIIISIVLLVGTIVFALTYYLYQISILYTLAITCGTCFYHFAMRLVVGHLIDAIYHNKMNYNKWWFKERKFESRLYKFLHVKNWKKFLPTYNPKDYNVKENSIESIIQVTCQAEIVHEIIMILSFIPIIFTIWFDSLVAFIVTSVISFFFDGLFVILQRYNRPRLVKILQRQNKKTF